MTSRASHPDANANGRDSLSPVAESVPPASEQSDRQLLEHIADRVAEIDTRLELVRGQQRRQSRLLTEAIREAREARAQANRVESAHDADVAARAGRSDAMVGKIVDDAVAAKGDRRKLVAAIVTGVLALLAAAFGVGRGTAEPTPAPQHQIGVQK